jgi:hypothetical protein
MLAQFHALCFPFLFVLRVLSLGVAARFSPSLSSSAMPPIPFSDYPRHPFLFRMLSVPAFREHRLFVHLFAPQRQHYSLRSFHHACSQLNVPDHRVQHAATELRSILRERNALRFLREAILLRRPPRQLRVLFAHLLINGVFTNPCRLWELFQEFFSRDFILLLDVTWPRAIELILEELNELLQDCG